MRNIDFKTPAIVIVVCLAIGGVIDYFSEFNWLTSGLVLLAALLANGLMIDVEDRQPGGLDFDENESAESKRQHKRLVVIHIGIIIFVIGAAIWSA